MDIENDSKKKKAKPHWSERAIEISLIAASTALASFAAGFCGALGAGTARRLTDDAPAPFASADVTSVVPLRKTV